jgi:hypothetical protein
MNYNNLKKKNLQKLTTNFFGLRAGYPLYPHKMRDAVPIPKPVQCKTRNFKYKLQSRKYKV